MNKLKSKSIAVFAIAMLILGAHGVQAQQSDTTTCAAYTGQVPAPGVELVYQTNGKEIVRHHIKETIEGDKIVVETSIPIVTDNTITGHHTYTQHIHRGSRQVVWTSEPITNRTLPGVLPQSDYTDLWIPRETRVNERLNIQNTTLLVGQINTTTIFVGDQTNVTTNDARRYDRTTGVFTGFNSSGSAPQLTTIQRCVTQEPPQPPTPTTTPSFVATAIAPGNITVGQEATITVSVKNNGPTITGTIIDFEVYDASNNKIFQQFVDTAQTPFESGATKQFSFIWTPRFAGDFIGKLGIFTGGWQRLLLWENELLPRITVDESQTTGVTFTRAFVTSTPFFLSQRAIVHAVFTGGNQNQNVLLDLELYNAKNERVAQAWFDNVTVSSSAEIEKTLDVPRNLPNGVYTLRVGIFNPGWNGLLEWYGNALTFALNENGQWEDNIVMMTNAFANPPEIDAGETSTLAAAFASPNTENHVDIVFTLLNSQNTMVSMQTFSDVAFPRAGTGNFQNVYTHQSPATLVPGEYMLKVEIYTPGKGKLINSYPNATSLKVI